MEQLTILRFFNFLPRAIFISYRSSVSSSLRVFLVYSLYSLSSFCRIKQGNSVCRTVQRCAVDEQLVKCLQQLPPRGVPTCVQLAPQQWDSRLCCSHCYMHLQRLQ